MRQLNVLGFAIKEEINQATKILVFVIKDGWWLGCGKWGRRGAEKVFFKGSIFFSVNLKQSRVLKTQNNWLCQIRIFA